MAYLTAELENSLLNTYIHTYRYWVGVAHITHSIQSGENL